mgnify:FL=1
MLGSFIWTILTLQAPLPGTAPTTTSEIVREARAMGTEVRITVQADTREHALRLSESLLLEIERRDRLLSTWAPKSPLSQLNRSVPGTLVPLPEEVIAFLSEARHWSERTGGSFDPAVGALVDAWDQRGSGRVPTGQELAIALENTGQSLLRIEGAHAVREKEAVWVDTGAFGKGAGLRAVKEILEEELDARVLVDLGGQLLVRSPGSLLREVEVAHPSRRGESILTLTIANGSIATSGTSERWFENDGERYGHILDPRTGLPVAHWGSVTVVSEDPFEADVLATALYVMGPDEALVWAERNTRAAVLVVHEREEGLDINWTSNMEVMLEKLKASRF